MADNGLGHTGSATFTWNTTNTEQAPVVLKPFDPTNVNGDTTSLQVYANDPDGDTLSYLASGLPSGLSINASTGQISGTISASASGSSPYTVMVSAAEGTLSKSQ